MLKKLIGHRQKFLCKCPTGGIKVVCISISSINFSFFLFKVKNWFFPSSFLSLCLFFNFTNEEKNNKIIIVRIACCKHKCYVLCLCFFTFILMRFIDYDMHIIIIPIDCNHVINFQFLLPAFCVLYYSLSIRCQWNRTYVGLVTDIKNIEVNRVPRLYSQEDHYRH